MSIFKAPYQVSNQDSDAINQWQLPSSTSPLDLTRPGNHTKTWPVLGSLALMKPNWVIHPIWPLKHMMTVVDWGWHWGLWPCMFIRVSETTPLWPCELSIKNKLTLGAKTYLTIRDGALWELVPHRRPSPQKWRIIFITVKNSDDRKEFSVCPLGSPPETKTLSVGHNNLWRW